jgi:hypothetical protein
MQFDVLVVLERAEMIEKMLRLLLLRNLELKQSK